MTSKLIPIRDTRNGVSAMLPEAYLEHPHWAKHFQAVRTTKPVIDYSIPEVDETIDFEVDTVEYDFNEKGPELDG